MGGRGEVDTKEGEGGEGAVLRRRRIDHARALGIMNDEVEDDI